MHTTEVFGRAKADPDFRSLGLTMIEALIDEEEATPPN